MSRVLTRVWKASLVMGLVIVLAVAVAFALLLGRGHQKQPVAAAKPPVPTTVSTTRTSTTAAGPAIGVIGSYNQDTGLDASSNTTGPNVDGATMALGGDCCQIVDQLTPQDAIARLRAGELIAVISDKPKALLQIVGTALPGLTESPIRLSSDFSAMQTKLKVISLVALPVNNPNDTEPQQIALMHSPVAQKVHDGFFLLASGNGVDYSQVAQLRKETGKALTEQTSITVLDRVVADLQGGRAASAATDLGRLKPTKLSASTNQSVRGLAQAINKNPHASSTLDAANQLQSQLVDSFAADYNDPVYAQQLVWLSLFDASVAG